MSLARVFQREGPPPWARFAEPDEEVLALFARPALPVNATPCPRCGRVYRWRGSREQIEETVRSHAGLCPACVIGRSPEGRVELGDFRPSFSASVHPSRPRRGRGRTR